MLFDRVTLLLRGGGMGRAYQAGVHQAVAGTGQCPDWGACVSIGTIDAVIIAGVRPPTELAPKGSADPALAGNRAVSVSITMVLPLGYKLSLSRPWTGRLDGA